MKILRGMVIGAVLILMFGVTALVGFAQEPFVGEGQQRQTTAVLFENVRIFDGNSEQLSQPSQVLVVGNQITTINTRSVPIPANSNLTRIDGARAGADARADRCPYLPFHGNVVL